MLDKLFGSKTRAKLLKIFMLEEGPFYVREIAKKAEAHINGVRRELENLEKIGIIENIPAEQRGKKYYLANKNFVLYGELKSLMNKSQLILQDSLIREVNKLGQIKLLVLTGLFTNFLSAQTDILIVGKINRHKLESFIKKMQRELNEQINYTVMSPSEFRYRKDLTDRFLFNILENRCIVLIDQYKLNGG